jgi:hypothetical protein
LSRITSSEVIAASSSSWASQANASMAFLQMEAAAGQGSGAQRQGIALVLRSRDA